MNKIITECPDCEVDLEIYESGTAFGYLTEQWICPECDTEWKADYELVFKSMEKEE